MFLLDEPFWVIAPLSLRSAWHSNVACYMRVCQPCTPPDGCPYQSPYRILLVEWRWRMLGGSALAL